MNRLIWLLMFMLMQVSKFAEAKDFGIKGHSHPILEQGFLKMIDERLQKVDLAKEQEKMKSIVTDRVNSPSPVEWLYPAIESRTFFFDPTVTLQEDIILPCGTVLHKAGTSINPLDHMDLNRRLYFVDARQEEQIIWLKQQLKAVSRDKVKGEGESDSKEQLVENRIILTGGSPLKLKEELEGSNRRESLEGFSGLEAVGNNIYFDQSGELVSRFGIKATPAVAEQEGKLIKIMELGLKRNKSD